MRTRTKEFTGYGLNVKGNRYAMEFVKTETYVVSLGQFNC